MDALLKWWYATPKGAKITKVLAFDTDDVRVEYLQWKPDKFIGNWEDHVRHVAKFEPSRLEIRILEKGKKRRVVLYPGTPCDPEFPLKTKHVIVSAVMIPKFEGVKPVDVTTRVQKYIGNSMASVGHMFPFDDPDALGERWSGIRLLDLTMSVVDVPLATTPPTPQSPQEAPDQEPVARD